MGRHLRVVVFILKFEEGRASVDGHKIDAANLLNLCRYALKHLVDGEAAFDEMHSGKARVEAHIMRHSDPAHPNIVGVFSREVENATRSTPSLLAECPALHGRRCEA